MQTFGARGRKRRAAVSPMDACSAYSCRFAAQSTGENRLPSRAVKQKGAFSGAVKARL